MGRVWRYIDKMRLCMGGRERGSLKGKVPCKDYMARFFAKTTVGDNACLWMAIGCDRRCSEGLQFGVVDARGGRNKFLCQRYVRYAKHRGWKSHLSSKWCDRKCSEGLQYSIVDVG